MVPVGLTLDDQNDKSSSNYGKQFYDNNENLQLQTKNSTGSRNQLTPIIDQRNVVSVTNNTFNDSIL